MKTSSGEQQCFCPVQCPYMQMPQPSCTGNSVLHLKRSPARQMYTIIEQAADVTFGLALVKQNGGGSVVWCLVP
jgi:hypothetical protein